MCVAARPAACAGAAATASRMIAISDARSRKSTFSGAASVRSDPLGKGAVQPEVVLGGVDKSSMSALGSAVVLPEAARRPCRALPQSRLRRTLRRRA